MKKYLALLMVLITYSAFSQQIYNKLSVKDFTNTNTAIFNTSYTGVAKLSSGILSASPIVNADVSASAAIAYSKFAAMATGQVLLGNAGVPTATTLTGGATVGATGVVTLGNSAVITQLLTGYTAGVGTVSSSDSILSAIQKVDGNGIALASSTTTALNGKQSLSTIVQKGDIYVGSAAGATQRLGSAGNGAVLTVDIDTAANYLSYRSINEDESVAVSFSGFDDPAPWSKGNNTNIMGGGSLAATFARDISTTKVSPNGSYKLTQAAGSLNDYYCTVPRTVSRSGKGDTYLVFRSTYDGNSGDIQPYLWDATNSVPLTLAIVKPFAASNASSLSAYSTNIPDGTNSVQICFQVKTLNTGKIFNASQFQITKSIESLGTLSSTEYQASTMASATAFTGTVSGALTSSVGSGIYSYNSVTGLYTALKTGIIHFSVSMNGTAAVFTKVYKNGSVVSSAYSVNSAGYYIVNSIPFPVVVGDTFYAGLVSGTASDTRVNIVASSSNDNVASSNQITTSDSAVPVHKTTAIVDGDPNWTYNTYTYAANSNTPVIATSAPTQTAASINANGFFLTGRAYNVASTAALPSHFVIKIGKGLKGRQIDAYVNTAKSGGFAYSYSGLSGSTARYYTDVAYDEATGLLTISAGVNDSLVTTRGLGATAAGGAPLSGYFVINASTLPNISVIPNASVCSGTECMAEFFGRSTSTGVISGEATAAVGWLTCGSTAPYACTFNTSLTNFKTAPVCIPGAGSLAPQIQVTAVSTTGLTIATSNSAGASTASDFTVTCYKSSADAKPAMFKTANIIGVPSVPGITNNNAGNNVEIFSFSYGTTSNNTVCSASPCSFLDQIGSAVATVSRVSGGVYMINATRTYAKWKCTATIGITSSSVAAIHPNTPLMCTNCSSMNFQTTDGTIKDSFGTMNCQGTY